MAGQKPLDQRSIYRLAVSLTRLLQEKNGPPQVLIARDTRASGVWIEELLAQGIERSGGRVIRAGVISTPGASFLTRNQGLDAGVVVSASHNPYQDNGIKIFSGNGLKLSDDLETALEKRMLSGEEFEFEPVSQSDSDLCDLRSFNRGCYESYVNFLLNIARVQANFHKMKVVLDCANGAAFKLAPRVFSDLGAEVIVINAKPDGYNINLHCGSLHLESVQRAVLEHRPDFGVSFDGDADRAIFTDKAGEVIDGDHVLFIFAKYLKLNKPAVVGTVMSNVGLEIALQKNGIQLLRSAVGDRYVYETMMKENINIGGEQSGHIILSDYSIAGDGILTALKVFELLAEHETSLSALADGFQQYPQILVNVRVKEKIPFAEIPQIEEEVRRIKQTLGQFSRVLLRYSGTEPLARIMIEGESQSEIKKEAESLAHLIAAKLA